MRAPKVLCGSAHELQRQSCFWPRHRVSLLPRRGGRGGRPTWGAPGGAVGAGGARNANVAKHAFLMSRCPQQQGTKNTVSQETTRQKILKKSPGPTWVPLGCGMGRAAACAGVVRFKLKVNTSTRFRMRGARYPAQVVHGAPDAQVRRGLLNL